MHKLIIDEEQLDKKINQFLDKKISELFFENDSTLDEEDWEIKQVNTSEDYTQLQLRFGA